MYSANNIKFIKQLILIAFPISLQVLLFSSRNLVDIMMLGQLGDTEVAAIGVAGRVSYIAILLFIGVATGGGILLAQYWGKKELNGLKQTFSLTLMCSLFIGALIAFSFYFFPHSIMGISTEANDVIERGAGYLKITSLAMLFSAIGVIYAAGLRSINQAGISTFFSCIGVALNIVLNYILIFGHFGFAAMGIEGAAIATLISCSVEISLLLLYIYIKNNILALRPSDVFHSFQRSELFKLIKLSAPVTINMLIYSAGLFFYSVIFGHINTQALASLTVMIPVESMATALLIGVATATSVVLGNEIGSGDTERTYQHAWLATMLSLFVGVITAATMLLLSPYVFRLFSGLDEETLAISQSFYNLLALGVVIRSLPLSMIIGVLRSGGDNKFCLYQDVFAQWVIGIPLVTVLAFYTEVSLAIVYLAIFSEEIIKVVLSTWRIQSKVWIKSLID
ncbi:MATE family efflux transporter [Psychromonas sp. Urea-02u-13]|uniref:MATE family efflux transporter n=1 Tax=Psychromonas sp. Urea-02u-13 TaxID=2058326 RepID=UPI000C31EC82|nr:MATE family efflux transporter [Psychromonas sp. Urea-02u-13]PKG37733.1 MATE family efflux transporter [Psychromonas sp. Urea-02u-13]